MNKSPPPPCLVVMIPVFGDLEYCNETAAEDKDIVSVFTGFPKNNLFLIMIMLRDVQILYKKFPFKVTLTLFLKSMNASSIIIGPCVIGFTIKFFLKDGSFLPA